MDTVKKKVLLCIGESSEADNNGNQYKRSLLESNFDCNILQVLHFEFIHLDELKSHLENFHSFDGLILTSPRAVEAISMIKFKNSLCTEEWRKKPTFCIGHSTELVAREQAGLVNILGTNSGNAKNLANFIVDSFKKDINKPLLLPCSDIARNTLPLILLENEIEVKKIVVYKTKAHDSLKESLCLSLKESPDVLVFFSPSIVDNVILALDNDKSLLEKFKIIAIGPVTEQALVGAGIQVDGVAEKPEPKALTEIISRVF